MVDKLEDVWASRDFPVLVEVARRIDAGEKFLTAGTVAESLGVPVEQVKVAADALERRRLVVVDRGFGGRWEFKSLSGQAYLLTGLHPSADDDVDRFVEALRKAADQVDDPEEASGLRKLARSAGDVSTNVLGAVLAAVATRAAGL